MHHGKEIYLFFNIYGINGIIGIIISQLIIGVIIYKVLIICNKENIEKYTELSKYLNKNKKINEVLKIIINIFLLITFYVMIAGFGAYFSQEIGIPSVVGTLVIILLCYIIFMGNIDGIIKVNIVLIPILIFFIIILSIKNLDAYINVNNKMIEPNILKAIYSAILYSSYNSITLIPIIITLKKYLNKKKYIIITSLLSTIILTIIAIAIYGLILKINIDINLIELPTVYVASMNGVFYKYLYGGIILVAIFTSAISAGYSFLKNFVEKPNTYKTINFILCGSAIFVSNIGFSNLINLLYPVFGFLGIIQIIFLITKNT